MEGGEKYLLHKCSSSLADMASYQGYNLMNGLRKWRSAKAKMDAGMTEIVDINFLGDSITEGAFASGGTEAVNWINTSYVGKIRNYFKAKYGDVGTGIITPVFPKDYAFVTKTGFTVGDSGYGFSKIQCQTSTEGATLSFSFNGTGVRLYYVQGTDAMFTTQVDGGAAVQRNATGTFLWAKTLDITGLADGGHTMVITKNGNDGKLFYFGGFMPIKGTAGIRCNMIGKYGTLSTYVNNDVALEYQIANAPKLTVISLIANDHGNQTAISTYTANMSSIIDKALTVGDVLLTTVGASNIAKTIDQMQYINAIKSLAVQKNCAFCDINSRWGGNANLMNTGFFSDQASMPHPNLQGHQDIANAILNILNQ